MGLLFIWVIFTIIVGFSKTKYIYFIIISLLMLFVTQIYNNKKNDNNLPTKNIIILSSITSLIIWYLAYICNKFLWVYPYNWSSFVFLFCFYTYILFYIFIES